MKEIKIGDILISKGTRLYDDGSDICIPKGEKCIVKEIRKLSFGSIVRMSDDITFLLNKKDGHRWLWDYFYTRKELLNLKIKKLYEKRR